MNAGCISNPTGAGGVLMPGMAKAYVKFVWDGTGKGIRFLGEPFNVASVARNGIGDYTINFARGFADPHFVAIAMAKSNGGTLPAVGVSNNDLNVTGSKRIITAQVGGSALDVEIYFVAFGNM